MAGEIRKIKREAEKLREKTAQLVCPGFSYSEQELIRRVFKAVLPQFMSNADRGTAEDILKKTEWLDTERKE